MRNQIVKVLCNNNVTFMTQNFLLVQHIPLLKLGMTRSGFFALESESFDFEC